MKMMNTSKVCVVRSFVSCVNVLIFSLVNSYSKRNCFKIFFRFSYIRKIVTRFSCSPTKKNSTRLWKYIKSSENFSLTQSGCVFVHSFLFWHFVLLYSVLKNSVLLYFFAYFSFQKYNSMPGKLSVLVFISIFNTRFLALKP